MMPRAAYPVAAGQQNKKSVTLASAICSFTGYWQFQCSKLFQKMQSLGGDVSTHFEDTKVIECSCCKLELLLCRHPWRR